MTDEKQRAVAGSPDGRVPAPLPDDRNPAIIDARKTFIITLIGAALFVGAVFVFIL